MASTKSYPKSPEGIRFFSDEKFCRSIEHRISTAGALVDNLPHTASDIEILISEAPHRLSREVQFSIFNCLDYQPVNPRVMQRLLPAVHRFLLDVPSRTAYAYFICGCMLGGGWHEAANRRGKRQIEDCLTDAVFHARYVAGRAGGLHGIEHALNTASVTEGRRLLDAIRRVYDTDRSIHLRQSAFFILKKGQWWGDQRALRELKTYARKLGRSLEYPQPVHQRLRA